MVFDGKKSSVKLKFQLLIFGIGLLILLLFLTRNPITFEKFSNNRQINDNWRAVVASLESSTSFQLEPRYIYSIINKNGVKIEIARLEFDELDYAYLDRLDQHLLLTRYYGSGSSSAYYYQIYQLSSDSSIAMKATVSYDSSTSTDGCLDRPVLANSGDPVLVFSSCGYPTLDGETLIFETPGWHCGLLGGNGGCLHRDEFLLTPTKK